METFYIKGSCRNEWISNIWDVYPISITDGTIALMGKLSHLWIFIPVFKLCLMLVLWVYVLYLYFISWYVKYKKYILNNPCQDLILHNIWSLGSLFLLMKKNFDSTCRSALRKSNIKLTMRKHRSSKIKTNILNRLTLRLIDGHCKSQMNRELMMWKRDVHVPLQRPLEGSRLWRSMRGHPGLRASLASGKPEHMRELRYSTG